MTVTDGRLPLVPPSSVGATGRRARRTFDALSVDEARVVLQIRPDPVASVFRSGPNPTRILCFGGGPLRGIGLRDHEAGLPGRVADRLVELTERGTQIDVIVESEPTESKALAGLSGLRLRRYDAVIVFVGDDGSAAQLDVDRWRGAFVGLTKLLLEETCGDAGLFVYESARTATDAPGTRPSRSATHAERLLEVTAQVCALTDRIRFAELRPLLPSSDPSGRCSDATAADWADLIATRLGPTFDALARVVGDGSPRAYRNRPQPEAYRQRALDALRLRSSERDAELDREVEAARALYGVSGAALTIIDGPMQWSRASTRAQPLVIPREAGLCTMAISTDELTLINDTRLNPRTRSLPLAQGPEGIRFYAGFPVHSPDGYRVGMVCVYSTSPRSMRPRELEGLRDIAARIERHLWSDVLKGRPA